MAEIMKVYPWIVYEENGKILGYAYGGPYLTRDAYQWTVECSIYLDTDSRGRGIGSALYDVLFDILKKQNFCVCYSLVSADNVPSLKMHEKYGFAQIGVLKSSGYKLGVWHSVVILEKQLNEFLVPPRPIIPINEVEYKF